MSIITIPDSAKVIKYDSFGMLSTPKTIWTPGPQESIFLTAVQVSAPLAVSVLLRDGGNDFLSLRVTEPFSSTGQRFPSAYQLGTGNALLVRTSEEGVKCNTTGATGATQVNYNGRSNFSNVNNAIGLANGSLAVLNSALGARSGRINLDYNLLPAQYDSFEIESVVINYYCRVALTLAVGTSTMILCWRPNAAANWTDLQQISLSLVGSVNHLVNPASYDITSAVLAAPDPWAVINNMQTSLVGEHTGLGLGNVVELDAVEVEVCVTGKNEITLFGYEG